MSSSGAISPVTATFARNLKFARAASGLTQHQLAVAMGRGDGMRISEWERGKSRPSDENLVRLAEVLGREVGWFFADNEPNGKAA